MLFSDGTPLVPADTAGDGASMPCRVRPPRRPLVRSWVFEFPSPDGGSVATVNVIVATRKSWLRFFAKDPGYHSALIGFAGLVVGVSFGMQAVDSKPF